MSVNNQDFRKGDYGSMSMIPRPSHADYTYLCKYGVKASSGGGRSSARETIGRVAAAGVAEKWLSLAFPQIQVIAFVSKVGNVGLSNAEIERLCLDPNLSRSVIDASGPVRCPDESLKLEMQRVSEKQYKY